MPRHSRQLSGRDEDLLSLRLCDLPVKLSAPPLQRCINQLFRELRCAGIRFRPHLWLSDAWFTPDDTGGIAVPFYLAHPRLRRLEYSQMFDIEGGTHESCMQLLRHETGHAIDNAYQLHERRDYKKIFGNYHQPYPDTYRPRPHSRDFVTHLDMWYAQAHPAEDFAETFSVWLNPNSLWRHHYANWPALKKLETVDEMMREIGSAKRVITTREQYKPLHSLRVTLREHYEHKRRLYLRTYPRIGKSDLHRIFSDEAKYARRTSAADFVESIRTHLRETVSRWAGESALTIDATLVDIQVAARRLHLFLHRPQEETQEDLLMVLAVQTMKFRSSPKHRVVV